MENTIEEVNKKYERYTFLNQKFNEYMKKSYNIQKIFDLKEKPIYNKFGEIVRKNGRDVMGLKFVEKEFIIYFGAGYLNGSLHR